MINRAELSKEAIEQFNTHKNIILQYATGVGKSKVAIDCINSVINTSSRVLLLVAERAHIKNWKEELTRWKLEKCNLTIICYASLHKYANTNWDIICFDEAHHAVSDRRCETLKTIKTNYNIALSATLKKEAIERLVILFGRFHISKVGLNKAIDNDILPKPKVFLVPLTLDNTKKEFTIKESWGGREVRKGVICDYSQRWNYLKCKSTTAYNLTIICTAKEAYDYYNDQYNYWYDRYIHSRIAAHKNKFLQAATKRKNVLGEAKSDIIYEFLRKQGIEGNKRYICFCTNIKQADYLGNKDSVVHSKISNPNEVIQNFNDEKTNCLYAVGMLQEGMNLKNIEVGIIIQMGAEERAFVQKLGRVLRADSPEQYIFYYKNTRDEELLKSVYENIDNKYIQKLEIQ